MLQRRFVSTNAESPRRGSERLAEDSSEGFSAGAAFVMGMIVGGGATGACVVCGERFKVFSATRSRGLRLLTAFLSGRHLLVP